MAATDPQTIILKGGGIFKELFVDGGDTLQPGQLVQQVSTTEFEPHPTENGNIAPVLVCVERAEDGKDIDTVHPAADTVRCVVPQPGSELYMWLAEGENVGALALLGSKGNGDLAANDGLQAVIEGSSGSFSIYEMATRFRALEAVNASAGRARIKVEVL